MAWGPCIQVEDVNGKFKMFPLILTVLNRSYSTP